MRDVAEGAAVVVKVGVVRNIVRHVDLEPAVLVEVMPDGAQAPAGGIGHAQLFGNVGEPAAVIAIQPVLRGRERSGVQRERNGRVELIGSLLPVGGVDLVIHVAAHVKVQVAIIIEVTPGDA